jgi:hypothetical protein
MTVFNCGAVGIASPPHVSQCCPQPSPEYDARKNTPQRITTKLYASANHANFVKAFVFGMPIPFAKNTLFGKQYLNVFRQQDET